MKIYRHAYTCNLQELKNREKIAEFFKIQIPPLKCPNSPLGGNSPRLGTTDLENLIPMTAKKHK